MKNKTNKRSRWQLFKNHIRDYFTHSRKCVFYNQPVDLTFYLQALEDTEGNYYRRLQYNGQMDTVIDGRYSPKFPQD